MRPSVYQWKCVVDNGLTWPTTHATQAESYINQKPKLVAPAQLNRDQALSGLLALRSSFATAWACALSSRDAEIWAREKTSFNMKCHEKNNYQQIRSNKSL